MDDADHAKRLEETHHQTSLAAQLRRSRLSNIGSTANCMACGEGIPPERLAVQSDCHLCVECQSEFEQGMGR